ncbi:MAG TPA: flagellar basal body P-ring formation chaperone FlgA [Candidatus Sumerlaeota bacterium]|nr:flagellar basal body P-ring formation chaperone FlgA [Candidatus Sumerlaeota bacterium]
MDGFFLRFSVVLIQGLTLVPLCGAENVPAPSQPGAVEKSEPVAPSSAAPVVATGTTGTLNPAPPASPEGKQAVDSLFQTLNQKIQTRILFRETCAVRGGNYTLADVADIECVDYEKGMRLAQLELGKSPAIGLRTTLNPASLRQRLSTLGVGDEAVLVLPRRMTIERESQQVEPAQVEQAVRDTLLQNAGPAPDRLIIEEFRIPPASTVPAGELSFKIELRLPRKGGGTATFSAIPVVDGVSQRTLFGSFRVDYQVDVLQLASSVEAGQVIGTDSVVTGQARASELDGKSVGEDQLKTGLKAKRALRPGEPLTWEAVAREELVRRGQTVQIVAEKGVLRIAAKGTAQASGSLGDEIAVENTQSRKRLQGIVTGPGEVSVSF